MKLSTSIEANPTNDPENLDRSGDWRWSEQAVIPLVAVATVVLLQATRVFLSYVMFGIEQRSNFTLLGATAAAVPAAGLGGVLIHFFGKRPTIVLSVIGLVLSRIVLQFWTEPEARIIAGAIVIASWGWLMLALLETRRIVVGTGLVAGFGLDFAIGTALRTVDPPWMPGAIDHLLTALLLVVLVVSALAAPTSAAPVRPATAVTLFAIGPGMVVYHLVTGSAGLVAVNADLAYPYAAAVLAVGLALGVAGGTLLSVWPERLRPGGLAGTVQVLVVTGVGALGLWPAWSAGRLAPLGFVLVAACATILTARAVIGREPVRDDVGPIATAIWFTAGIGAQALLLVLYFMVSNVLLAILLAYGFVALCALASSAEPGRGPSANLPRRRALITPATLSVLLLAATGGQALAWDPPETGPPLSGEITVITFNIQTGFTADDDFDLEAIAQTIEATGADVVILQEVARGWPFTTGIDQAVWLSERLGMPFVFGQSESLRLWSVAILSRAPMTDVLRFQFSVLGFENGAVAALIEAEGEDLWVFGTHLAAPRSVDDVRVVESRRLLEAWGQREPAVIAGDFNAGPDSLAVQELIQAGLVDVGLATGVTEPTFLQNRRIDHIFVTPGIEIVRVYVPETDVSDHDPVVAVLRLPGGE